MIDGEKNAGEDGDAGVEVETRREAIAKEQTGRGGRDHGLDVEDDVDDRRVAVLEREGEENRPHRRAGESGEDQKAPGARVDPGDLAKLHHEKGQKDEEDQHVFPKDDHLGVEQIVKRDAPGAFGAPKRRSERDQPGTISRAARFAVCHAARVYR